MTSKFPVVVCLCGSTRFFEQFMEANYRETMEGRIVLSVGFYAHRPDTLPQPVTITSQTKTMLDDLHLTKIDYADRILVINVDGYIGKSTRREIWYALDKGKDIFWWDNTRIASPALIRSWFKNHSDWLTAAQGAAESTPS